MSNARPSVSRPKYPREAVDEGSSPDRLQWSGATAGQLAFMRQVYKAQVERASSARTVAADLPAGELAVVEAQLVARRQATAACQQLLAAAREQLSKEQQSNSARAATVSEIAVTRAYEAASQQLFDWQRAFPNFYAQTADVRANLPGGEHGDAAVLAIVAYVGARQAAPGFGIHNLGNSIDFRTCEGDVMVAPDGGSGDAVAWQRTWLADWLAGNARKYGFVPNSDLVEPWHWQFEAVPPPAQEDVALDQAVQQNRYWSAQIGWTVDKVASLLNLDSSPNDQAFAQIVANWQQINQLPIDGILGPQTWAAMQKQLSRASSAGQDPGTQIAGGIDLDQAVQQNRYWSAQIGWTVDQVASILNLDSSPDEQSFAQIVANWQQINQLPVDGILGPQTWNAMRRQFGLMRAGSVSSPTIQVQPVRRPSPAGAATGTVGSTYVIGVDLSHHNQGSGKGTGIDWGQIRSDPQGIAFVYLKASDGNTFVDPDFALRWRSIAGSGLYRGAYHFFRGWASGIDQAQFFSRTIDRAGGLAVDDLPLMLDVEFSTGDEQMNVGGSDSQDPALIQLSSQPRTRYTRPWQMTASDYLSEVEACLDEIQRLTGIRPLIYTGGWVWKQLGNPPRCSQYPLWVSHYSSTPQPALFGGWNKWAIWQYSPRGQVNGIQVNPDRNADQVDMDRYKGQLDDFASRSGPLFN